MTFYRNKFDTWGNPESVGNFVKVPFTPMIFSFDGKNARVVGMKDPTERMVSKITDSRNLSDRQLSKRIEELRVASRITKPTGPEEYADMFIQQILSQLDELKYTNSAASSLTVQFLKEHQILFSIVPDVDEVNNRQAYVRRLPPYIIGAHGQKTTKLPAFDKAVETTNDGIPPLVMTNRNGAAVYTMDAGLPLQFTFHDLYNSPLRNTIAVPFLRQLLRSMTSIVNQTDHENAVAMVPYTVAAMMDFNYYTLAFPFGEADNSPLSNLELAGSSYSSGPANRFNLSWSNPAHPYHIMLLDEGKRVGKRNGNIIKAFLISALETITATIPGISSATYSGINKVIATLQSIDFNTQSSNFIKRAVIETLLT